MSQFIASQPIAQPRPEPAPTAHAAVPNPSESTAAQADLDLVATRLGRLEGRVDLLVAIGVLGLAAQLALGVLR